MGHPPQPPITFLTWNVNLVMGKDHSWPSLTFHDLLWPSMTFYRLLRPLWPSIIKCLLSRPSLISETLKPKPKLNLYLSSPGLMQAKINSHTNPRLDPNDSRTSLTSKGRVQKKKVKTWWNFPSSGWPPPYPYDGNYFLNFFGHYTIFWDLIEKNEIFTLNCPIWCKYCILKSLKLQGGGLGVLVEQWKVFFYIFLFKPLKKF